MPAIAPTPFARLEQRANAAVLGHLANATASIAGAPAVGCVFDQDHQVDTLGALGMADAAVSVTLPTADVPSPLGRPLVEVTYLGQATTWRAVAHQPDGTGLSVLLLELAA